MTSTPLPEQGGFNEKLDAILKQFGSRERLNGWNLGRGKSTDDECEEVGEQWRGKIDNRIRTLVLEELESKSERLFEWDGGQYEPIEAVPLSVIKKLGDE